MAETRMWTRTVYTYLGARIPMHIVYYDDLLANTSVELRKIIKFIDAPVSKLDFGLVCAIEDLDANLHKPGNELNDFSKDYVQLVNRHIGNVRKTIDDQRRKFKPLPYYEKKIVDDIHEI